MPQHMDIYIRIDWALPFGVKQTEVIKILNDIIKVLPDSPCTISQVLWSNRYSCCSIQSSHLRSSTRPSCFSSLSHKLVADVPLASCGATSDPVHRPDQLSEVVILDRTAALGENADACRDA
uniref:Uncharacterized protein n=1 Tax=Arundo donax TaxID=35708 RepID=A0A0A9HP75_ARUDO